MKSVLLVCLLVICSLNLPAQLAPLQTIKGKASFYSDWFDGRLTANGEFFSQEEFTAAHMTFPFGTWLEVTNLDNQKSVFVRINDRGPYVKGRILDLSKAAAQALGDLKQGIFNVEIRVVNRLDILVLPLSISKTKKSVPLRQRSLYLDSNLISP
ncbi:septal ring lytic transglycosylase RlpA family protein [Ancylomarina salipaludis]|uniref:Probable endolytic peptidoglycan transglycosylase RlpA n=1 Tax=Ancylomarina salipaludis TaxID=2501299 RepID=A0A4Q1JNS6_9BACT|nr:septal ring lytic transglycosylase RlpA family protein [Ancylomarina salipaludis]RXQ96519.1 septal ring lytic transglycosylase RlpA family protein [Ancylomarina salipaludis]